MLAGGPAAGSDQAWSRMVRMAVRGSYYLIILMRDCPVSPFFSESMNFGPRRGEHDTAPHPFPRSPNVNILTIRVQSILKHTLTH